MTKNVSPIKPNEIVKKKAEAFPAAVFEAFNELIARDFGGGCATVRQDEVVELMVKKGLKQDEIFKNHWLDVEDVYRKAGWKVEYDKPAYNESYEPTFEFRTRK